MSPSYDPTLKTLVEASPADWLPLLGLPRKRVTVEDTDLATVVSGTVDKVLRVHAQREYLLHSARKGHPFTGCSSGGSRGEITSSCATTRWS